MRGEGVGIVGEIRVHLDEGLVAALEAPGETVPIGAAEPELGGPRQDVQLTQPLREVCGYLGRPVRAAVVDDEDPRIRQGLADSFEDALDCGSFVEGRQHNEDAHRRSLMSGSSRGDAGRMGDDGLLGRLGRVVHRPQVPRHHLDRAGGGDGEQCPDEATEGGADEPAQLDADQDRQQAPTTGSGAPSGSSRPD